MNLLDRKQQEDFFYDYLTRVLPQKHGIRVAASSYDEDWSAMRYTTASGPLIVRINDIEKPETDVPHRTGFVARLLAETGRREPEEYIRDAKGLFDGQGLGDFFTALSHDRAVDQDNDTTHDSGADFL